MAVVIQDMTVSEPVRSAAPAPAASPPPPSPFREVSQKLQAQHVRLARLRAH